MSVRTRLAEPGHACDDERWVEFQQYIGTETEPLERAGPEVLDQYVSLADQSQQQIEIVGRLQVESNRSLVPVDQLPPQPFAIARIPPRQSAQAVAAIGSFDLDHVGAEVGEVTATVGAGQQGRQIDDAQAMQGRL